MQKSYGSFALEIEPEKQRASYRLHAFGLLTLMLGYASFHSQSVPQSSFSTSDNGCNSTTLTPVPFPFQRYCVENVCLKASNGYERRLERAIANGLYDGIILELYQETAIEIETENDSVVCKSFEFADKDESFDVDVADRCTMSVTATALGNYTLSVVVGSDVTDASIRIVEFEMVAKYIRREIRDLDDEDRNRYLDAIAVTHSVSDEVGLRKYGEQYRSTNWFTQVHVYAGEDRTCDHWHSGPGFMNQHTAFTLRFEKSLQSVDPRTCVHYWDYTIDVAAGVECCWTESIVFSPDFFSTVDPNNTHHIVDTGRWAYTRLERMPLDSKAINPYGLLGVPWNTDPTPFMTRSQEVYGLKNYINIPYFGCGRARFLYQIAISFEFTAKTIDKFHSQVHGMTGGYWNYLDFLIEREDELNAWFYNTSSAFNSVSKDMYRRGILECPTFCSAETPAVNCSCGAATARIEANYPNYTSWELLDEIGALETLSSVAGGILDLSEHDNPIWDLALDQLCNYGHIGTVTSDASPMDPLFWTIHPMQERYIQFVRYLNDSGRYDYDQTWVDYGSGYYNWTNVTSPTQLPSVNDTGMCSGHRGDDLLIYPNLLENQATEYITNEEFHASVKAFSPHLPYVYDQLLNWTQCGWMLNEDE